MTDIDCTLFREQLHGWNTGTSPPDVAAWTRHAADCKQCRDFQTTITVRSRGVDPQRYPCIHLANYATMTCDQHPLALECPDILIYYSPRFDEYSLPVRDGGPSTVAIQYCPWCGTQCPQSKRDLWFAKLANLGYDDPFDQTIPDAFLSDAWYQNRE